MLSRELSTVWPFARYVSPAFAAFLSRVVAAHQLVHHVLRSQMVKSEQLNVELHALTAEGLSIAQNGSHEYLVWSALPTTEGAPLTAKEIEAKVGKDTAKVGQGKAMKNKWVVKKGDGFVKAVSLNDETKEASRTLIDATALASQQVDTVVDATKDDLLTVQSTGVLADDKLLAELRKRKLVEKKCVADSLTSLARGGGHPLTLAGLTLQEVLLLLGRQGTQVQYNNREARNRSHRRAPQLVRPALPDSLPALALAEPSPSPFLPPAEELGSSQTLRSTTLRPKEHQQTVVRSTR